MSTLGGQTKPVVVRGQSNLPLCQPDSHISILIFVILNVCVFFFGTDALLPMKVLMKVFLLF